MSNKDNIPDILKCDICGQACKRGIKVPCCNSKACRGCATKCLTRTKTCWIFTCGAKMKTGDMLIDQQLRDEVDKFLCKIKTDDTPEEPCGSKNSREICEIVTAYEVHDNNASNSDKKEDVESKFKNTTESFKDDNEDKKIYFEKEIKEVRKVSLEINVESVPLCDSESKDSEPISEHAKIEECPNNGADLDPETKNMDESKSKDSEPVLDHVTIEECPNNCGDLDPETTSKGVGPIIFQDDHDKKKMDVEKECIKVKKVNLEINIESVPLCDSESKDSEPVSEHVTIEECPNNGVDLDPETMNMDELFCENSDFFDTLDSDSVETEPMNMGVSLAKMRERNSEFERCMTPVERACEELRFGAQLELMLKFEKDRAKCLMCGKMLGSEFLILKHLQLKHKDEYERLRTVLQITNMNTLNMYVHRAIKSEFLFQKKQVFPISEVPKL